MEVSHPLRLCLLAAAAVLLLGFSDAKLAAAHAYGGAGNDLVMQAKYNRMLLQAQQDKILGRASYSLTSGVSTAI